jgi:hypothetical protein
VQVRRNGAATEGPTDAAELPFVLSLSNGYPNPAVHEVSLALALPRAANVRWSVHDLQGRTMRSTDEAFGAGRFTLSWDGRDGRGRRLPAGVYLVRVTVDETRFVRSVTLR